jgi:hypothetical protein
MLSDLDATIKELLKEAGGLGHAHVLPEVDISFEIPNREWSGSLNNRATVNCYLFDIHERRVLREDGWQIEGRGTRDSQRRMPPLFFELTYLITAWTKEVQDEHLLLWRVLETLMDNPVLRAPYLQGELVNHEWPITTTVGQLEGVLKSPGEFWTALENHLKPSLSYVVTLGRNRKPERTNAPPVLSTGIRLRLPEAAATTAFSIDELFGLPKGVKRSGITVTVDGTNVQATSDESGRVQFPTLAIGRHMLRAEIAGTAYRRTIVIRDAGQPKIDRLYHDIVLDQDGKGIPDVVVLVEGTDIRAETDKDGKFALALAPGRHVLRIQMDGWFQRREIVHFDKSYTMQLAFGGVPSDP